MAGRSSKKFEALVDDVGAATAADILDRVRQDKIKVHPYYGEFIHVIVRDNADLLYDDPVFSEASNDEICTAICVTTARLLKEAEQAKKKESYLRALYKAIMSQPVKLEDKDKAYAALVVRVHTRSLVEKSGSNLAPIKTRDLFKKPPTNCSDHQVSWGEIAMDLGNFALIGAAGVAADKMMYDREVAAARKANSGLGVSLNESKRARAKGMATGVGVAAAAGGLMALYEKYRRSARKEECAKSGCGSDSLTNFGTWCVTCGELVDTLQTARFRSIQLTTLGWVNFLMQQFALLTSGKPTGCVKSLEALAVLSLLAHTARNKRRLAGALDALLKSD